MNRPGAATIATVVALILGGAATWQVRDYLKKHSSGAFSGVSIVTAAADVPVGARLEPGSVKLATWPKEALPSGYCTDPKRLLGRVAVRQIAPGDVITETKLMPLKGAGTGIMTYMVPEGHRAVTVSVNEVAGVAGFITPNSRVDVVLTTPRPGKPDKEDQLSKIILQNIPVLACGQVTEQKDGKPTVVPTVTLDLVPDEAERLIVGAKKGSLQLLLRNMVDVAAVPTQGASVAKALGVTEAPVVVKPVVVKRVREVVARPAPPPVVKVAAPPQLFTVEVINGGSKSKREFAHE
ncbi:Flp pilus assembly protein CpaB [Geomesophilobacter sediminis]|uniref:Flp pilus assembly protein CpaB n=1 Tax=Geomesophilobacter sediminis TaxID=2798584 RepID=A0A8J7IZY1_9BACT|nr:Flp pilus assembly protein CpaB [Geomesophilobacter sediminis]MBJ6725732.1 Flp pilus assembly protein CpaB [Geomesophilobacter sediminis]